MTPSQRVPPLTIFISHASKDSDLAKRLAKLVKEAFNLRYEEIRCTSVLGFQLAAGSNIHERLKQEVMESKAFIAVITPASKESAYVLFELGARWGAALPLFPTLAKGATIDALRDGPLSVILALNLSDKLQVVRLIEDLGDTLEMKPTKISALEEAIGEVVEASESFDFSPNVEHVSVPEDQKKRSSEHGQVEVEIDGQSSRKKDDESRGLILYKVLAWFFDTDEEVSDFDVYDRLERDLGIDRELARDSLKELVYHHYLQTRIGRLPHLLMRMTQFPILYTITPSGRASILRNKKI